MSGDATHLQECLHHRAESPPSKRCAQQDCFQRPGPTPHLTGAPDTCPPAPSSACTPAGPPSCGGQEHNGLQRGGLFSGNIGMPASCAEFVLAGKTPNLWGLVKGSRRCCCCGPAAAASTLLLPGVAAALLRLESRSCCLGAGSAGNSTVLPTPTPLQPPSPLQPLSWPARLSYRPRLLTQRPPQHLSYQAGGREALLPALTPFQLASLTWLALMSLRTHTAHVPGPEVGERQQLEE